MGLPLIYVGLTAIFCRLFRRRQLNPAVECERGVVVSRPRRVDSHGDWVECPAGVRRTVKELEDACAARVDYYEKKKRRRDVAFTCSDMADLIWSMLVYPDGDT